MALTIDDYLKEWKENEGPREKNNPDFILAFTEYMGDPQRHYSFGGLNGYCGHTAYIADSYSPYEYYQHELAFGPNFVKVFDAKNGGFWVPEYIDLDGFDAEIILNILKDKLLVWAGFKMR